MADQHCTPELRTCTKCGETKPADLDHFRAEKRTKIGLQAMCRMCDREYRRARRAANPEEDRRYYEANKHWILPQMNERQKQRRRENIDEARRLEAEYREKNRDRVRQYQRDYYARNRDSERKRLTEYYENNPEKKAERYAQIESWRKANREKARSYVRNRRARIKASDGQHTADDIEKLKAGQKGCCWWCGKKIPDGKHHIDHRIPIARGGSNGVENLVVSCAPCNHKKSYKMPWEMEEPRLF